MLSPGAGKRVSEGRRSGTGAECEEEEEEEEGAARPCGAHCLSWQGRDNSSFSGQHRVDL